MSTEYNKVIFFTTNKTKLGVNHVDLSRSHIVSPLGLLFIKYETINNKGLNCTET